MKPIEEATTIEVEPQPSPTKVNVKPPLKIERKQSFDDDDGFANKPVAKKVNVAPVNGKVYSVADLQIATDSFSMDNLVGEGSLGRVYKAQFSDGKVNILHFFFLLLLRFSLFQRQIVDSGTTMESCNKQIDSISGL
jgi:hypothetical protein